MKMIKKSLKSIDLKLYLSLLFLGLCPTLYNTLRIYFLGQIPNEWSYSIAGQLSWVNLIYEVLNEAIILPLFFFIGDVIRDKEKLENRIKTGLVLSFGLYAVLSFAIIIFVKPMLLFMSVDSSIIVQSIDYIRIESFANLVGILSSFIIVALVTMGKAYYVYIITVARLILSIITDTFLVSTLPISLNLGVNGIGYSNIIVNGALFAIAVVILNKENIFIFKASKLNFSWIKSFVKIGGISGLESLVRNIAYMLMICKMVNAVGEQGTYWVANGFIWGWLLLPIIQLGELIKKEISVDKSNIKSNTLGYFVLTTIICVSWVISIPLWKPFMKNILGYTETDKLFYLVILLLGFYILFAYQNIFDATFYGLGKTRYMLFESVVTNSIYYGLAYILYLKEIWIPSLNNIALLFGFGIAFDSIVSLMAYFYLIKKSKLA